MPKEEIIHCVESPNNNFGHVRAFIPASVNFQAWSHSHIKASEFADVMTADDEKSKPGKVCDLLDAIVVRQGVENCDPDLLAYWLEHCKPSP